MSHTKIIKYRNEDSNVTSKKKIKTVNEPVLTDAFKRIGFFNKDVVTTYDYEDSEFDLNKISNTCPILPVPIEEKERIAHLSSQYEKSYKK